MNAELFPTAHLAGVRPATQFATLEDQAAKAEAWETPEWAARAILRVELLTPVVIDPCCGTGILSEAARAAGYDVRANDLYDWGYREFGGRQDFLTSDLVAGWCKDHTVLMNSPFSLATRFVDRAREAGARKIVCFQRWAWRESITRRDWWDAVPPARIWMCGARATCWLLSIPPEKRNGGTPVAHAWYVWERGHKGAELVNTLWRDR